MKTLKRIYKFDVGDVISSQGARLKILNRYVGPNGLPAYDVVSAFTKGEPWAVSERYFFGCKKVKERKGEFDAATKSLKKKKKSPNDKCSNCESKTAADELKNNDGYCDECHHECHGDL